MATWEEQFSAYLASHQLGTPLTYEQWLSNYVKTNVGVHKHPIKIRYTYPPPAPGAPIAPEYSQAALYMDFTNNAGRLNGTWGPALPLLTCTRASVAQMDTLEGWWGPYLANQPRWSNKGMWIEVAKTNSLRNNTMVGAVAGTPGTLPTNWNVSTGLRGLTQTIATGNAKGIDYIDFRLSGSPTTTGGVNLAFDANNNIAATPAQIWANSVFAAVVAGSLTGLGSVALNTASYDATPAFLGGSSTPLSLTTGPATLTRFVASVTAMAGTVWLQPYVSIGVTSGVPVDITLRIGWPQLEQGGFASSPIKTAGAAVTRADDVINVAGLTPDTAQGTVFAEYVIPFDSVTADTKGIFALHDGTNANRIFGSAATATDVTSVAGISASVSTLGVNASSTIPYAATARLATAFTVNEMRAAFNGVLGTADVSGAFPVGLTTLSLGRAGGVAGSHLDGYLRRLAYWPTRLTDAQLQAITA